MTTGTSAAHCEKKGPTEMSTHRENHAWSVTGIDRDGKQHALATFAEADAAELFWTIVDTHAGYGRVTFYGESRKFWLDEHTALAELTHTSFVGAAAAIDRLRKSAQTPIPSDEEIKAVLGPDAIDEHADA